MIDNRYKIINAGQKTIIFEPTPPHIIAQLRTNRNQRKKQTARIHQTHPTRPNG